MKNLWLIALLMCCGSFASAQVDFPDASGNTFLLMCNSIDAEKATAKDVENALACVSYTRGLEDGLLYEHAYAERKTGQKLSELFCQPEGVTSAQIVRVILKYIRDNPTEAHKITAILTIDALTKAFPCPAK